MTPKRPPRDSPELSVDVDSEAELHAIRTHNLKHDLSNEISQLTSELPYQNVAEAYINSNGLFTTAASTSSGRIRSLEQA